MRRHAEISRNIGPSSRRAGIEPSEHGSDLRSAGSAFILEVDNMTVAIHRQRLLAARRVPALSSAWVCTKQTSVSNSENRRVRKCSFLAATPVNLGASGYIGPKSHESGYQPHSQVHEHVTGSSPPCAAGHDKMSCSPKTSTALSRRNFGHTSSLSGRSSISPKMRGYERPGK